MVLFVVNVGIGDIKLLVCMELRLCFIRDRSNPGLDVNDAGNSICDAADLLHQWEFTTESFKHSSNKLTFKNCRHSGKRGRGWWWPSPDKRGGKSMNSL